MSNGEAISCCSLHCRRESLAYAEHHVALVIPAQWLKAASVRSVELRSTTSAASTRRVHRLLFRSFGSWTCCNVRLQAHKVTITRTVPHPFLSPALDQGGTAIGLPERPEAEPPQARYRTGYLICHRHAIRHSMSLDAPEADHVQEMSFRSPLLCHFRLDHAQLDAGLLP
ncbi:hypothetical protein EJ06DRAFT_223606 [Trichodelitschia bisporula]|uniref:Uncharacterized protein n=1 Tax=Trichodelitschia bisporula TaxID=703511 RepID=A0A6G1HL09_9PEZI|nr:hypothetical protein EJ06DRAFT_223606 [Trichodelitschia bisporula]